MINRAVVEFWANAIAVQVWPYLTVPVDALSSTRYQLFLNGLMTNLSTYSGSSNYDSMTAFNSFLQNMDAWLLRGVVSNAYSTVGITSPNWMSLADANINVIRTNAYHAVSRVDFNSPSGSSGGVTKIELAEVLISFAEDFLTDRTGPKVLVNGVLKAANLAERQAYWTPETDLESWVA